MFKAIEDSNGNHTKRQEDILNATNTSIAREIDGMHKEYQEQM